MIECWFKGHPKKVTNAILRVDKPRVIKRISDKWLFLPCWKRTISTHPKRGYPFTFHALYPIGDAKLVIFSDSVHFWLVFWRKEAPFSSKRTLVCTKRSRIASAAVVFPFITSYQSATGNCEMMMVAFWPCLSSMISIKSSSCWPSSTFMPKSSSMSRSVCASLAKNRCSVLEIRARAISSKRQGQVTDHCPAGMNVLFCGQFTNGRNVQQACPCHRVEIQ